MTPCLGGRQNILSSLEFQERLPANREMQPLLRGEAQQRNFQEQSSDQKKPGGAGMQPIGGCSQPGKLHLSRFSHTPLGTSERVWYRESSAGLREQLGFCLSTDQSGCAVLGLSLYFLILQVPRQHIAAHKTKTNSDVTAFHIL